MMAQSVRACAGAAPTPAETEAAVRVAISETAIKKRMPGSRALAAWLRDIAHAWITPKNDDSTNVIDQGERVTYSLGRAAMSTLFGHLEAARLEGTATHFSERQGTVATPNCGIMLDYDIVTRLRQPQLSDRLYYRFAGALVSRLTHDLVMRSAGELRLHVFFIVKAEAVALTNAGASSTGASSTGASSTGASSTGASSTGASSNGASSTGASSTGASSTGASSEQLYKFGLHILVPGVQVGRSYKKWLIREFRSEPGIMAAISELGAVGDPADCLDQNSASVPVLYFGSCKRGGTPYVLGAALEVTVDAAPPSGADGGAAAASWVAPPVIRKILPAELVGYNMVAELSLTSPAEYADGRAPLVTKSPYACTPAAEEASGLWADRAADGAIPEEALLLAEHTLSTLTLHNAEARHLHALLDLLPVEFSSDRNRWRDVIFALANTSDQYKPLAVWFSQRCPQKWADGGPAALDALWADATQRAGGTSTLTLRSIAHWARTANPERYGEVMERNYFTMLTTFVYEHGGRLQHYMIAKVLYAMLGTKFCVDIDVGARGGLAYCWFEFVLPGQQMRPGEVWKWRRETEPDDVHIYMSEKLSRVLDQISDHLEEKRTGAADEDAGRYYRDLGKSFAVSKGNLYNDTFKNGVIRQAGYLFRRRGFAETLDKLPGLFGTLNGVLRVSPKCELIDHFHEYPVSRFSPVAWKPFDPEDPWTKLALGAIADIIVEPDARDWILFHAAQGLSGDPKEGLFLMWEGGGQNGKTSFLRWVAKALGPYADKFNIQLMCSDREDADRPNSAMMRFKNLNYAYSEESNKSQSLNVARMKEMVNAGEVSGRDLNSKQETFTMRANLVAASQYSFIVNTTDHGTWRRLRHYTSKARFRRDPDPTNPFEKPDDQRFVREYPSDPQFQSSILSILSHYYERLQNEYRGELKQVRSPTIDGETEHFRVEQDALHRWICQHVVASTPENGAMDYPLGTLSALYAEWYSKNIERRHHTAGAVIKELESSALCKYLKPGLNGTLILRGCRILTAEDIALRDGEEFLAVAEARGGRTAAEIAAMREQAAADPRPWWAARSVSTVARPAPDASFIKFTDDRVQCARPPAAEQPAVAERAPVRMLSDTYIEDILDELSDSLSQEQSASDFYEHTGTPIAEDAAPASDPIEEESNLTENL